MCLRNIKTLWLRRTLLALVAVPILAASMLLGALAYSTEILGDIVSCWRAA